jgi:hypothetical protein
MSESVSAVIVDGNLAYTIDWNSGCSVRFTRDTADNLTCEIYKAL